MLKAEKDCLRKASTGKCQETHTFPRTNKLIRPQQFQQVFKSQCRSGDKAILVLARKNSKNIARLGMAVPKKHLPKANDRNRIKRIIRESFRTTQALLTGLDVVVVLKGTEKTSDNRLFRQTLEKHWKKVLVCKDSC